MKLPTLRSIWNKYMDWKFYHSQFVNEISEPLAGVSFVMTFMTMLAVLGFKTSLLNYFLIFAFITLAGTFVGYLLVKIGVIQYKIELSNQQNPMLNEVKKMVEEIKEAIKK